jgi:hypothetical protein
VLFVGVEDAIGRLGESPDRPHVEAANGVRRELVGKIGTRERATIAHVSTGHDAILTHSTTSRSGRARVTARSRRSGGQSGPEERVTERRLNRPFMWSFTWWRMTSSMGVGPFHNLREVGVPLGIDLEHRSDSDRLGELFEELQRWHDRRVHPMAVLLAKSSLEPITADV